MTGMQRNAEVGRFTKPSSIAKAMTRRNPEVLLPIGILEYCDHGFKGVKAKYPAASRGVPEKNISHLHAGRYGE